MKVNRPVLFSSSFLTNPPMVKDQHLLCVQRTGRVNGEKEGKKKRRKRFHAVVMLTRTHRERERRNLGSTFGPLRGIGASAHFLVNNGRFLLTFWRPWPRSDFSFSLSLFLFLGRGHWCAAKERERKRKEKAANPTSWTGLVRYACYAALTTQYVLISFSIFYLLLAWQLNSL